MTAMMSGIKTDGVIGVDEDIERGDCSRLWVTNWLRT